MAKRALSADEIRAWPVTVDVPTAGEAFGLRRTTSFRLARSGQFPVPVLPLGRCLRVTRASVMHRLGILETLPTERATDTLDGAVLKIAEGRPGSGRTGFDL